MKRSAFVITLAVACLAGSESIADAAPRHWTACSGSYTARPDDGQGYRFDSIRVRMARLHGAVKCRDARYLTKNAASYYEGHARLGRNPLAKISHCTYRPTKTGVIHAICEIYDNADLVKFSVRATASTAEASTFTGQQPADAAAGELAARAVTFWHQHGLAACPDGLTIWEAPKLPYGDGQEAWGMGDGATCEIWLSRALANQIDAPLWLGDGIAACTAMTHEVGHAFGLGHTAKGVMAGSGAPKRMYGWSPRFCWRWARFQDAAELRGEGKTERQISRVIRGEERLIRG